MSRPALFCTALLLANCLALAVTLHSLDGEPFDGMNNLFQLPLGLPWTFTPRGSNHVANAWIDFGCGLLNLVLVAAVVTRRARHASRDVGTTGATRE